MVPLIGILLVAPFFFVALFVGTRAVSLSQGAADDLLLVALATAGALASIVNGAGRHTAPEKQASGSHATVTNKARTRATSMIHLGY